MIVIDTSALVAILNHEPERTAFFEAIAAADRRLVSAVTYQEAGQVLFARRGINGLYDEERREFENAALMANHASTRTTQLYDRRAEEVTLDEVERILV